MSKQNSIYDYTFQNADEIHNVDIYEIINWELKKKESNFQYRIPVIVKEYYPKENSVLVQIAIKAILSNTDENGINLQTERPTFKVSVKQPFAGGVGIVYYPEEGDTGWVEASDRDTTLIKESKEKIEVSDCYSFSTARYSFGSFTPDSIIPNFTLKSDSKGGLTIQSKNASTRIIINKSGKIIIDAPSDVYVNGNIQVNGDIIAGTVSLKNHTHSGVMSGGSNTGVPNK